MVDCPTCVWCNHVAPGIHFRPVLNSAHRVPVYGRHGPTLVRYPLSAGSQCSAVNIACHDPLLQITIVDYPDIVRDPTLVRLFSSGKALH